MIAEVETLLMEPLAGVLVVCPVDSARLKLGIFVIQVQ